MKANEMRLRFSALPENEAFARLCVSAFVMPLNPTVEENEDVKTAVSEAVTNAIIHGYDGRCGEVELLASYDEGGRLSLTIEDKGCGIEDIAKAMEPMYTSRPDLERSGMGFAVMENFMDEL
jgi:stage II sporulation protein AB (anti-sigma F factor)